MGKHTNVTTRCRGKSGGLEDLMTSLFTHHNFNADVPVSLFNTEAEALNELKSQFDEELRIQTV